MSSVGERLREERERLRLSQEAFGELGGVSKRAQINYEKGERSPDAAYLSAIAGFGVDVLYVVTGQRPPLPTHLPPDEQLLVEAYRALDPGQKKQLLAALLAGDSVSKGGKKARGKRGESSVTQAVSGDGNRVAGRDYKE